MKKQQMMASSGQSQDSKKQNVNLLTDSIFSIFRKYLGSCILGMIILSCYVFVDTVCIGQALGGTGLAALNTCMPALSIILSFGFLFGTGGGTLYSIFRGSGEDGKADQVFNLAFFSAIGLAVIFAVLGNVFFKPLAFFLGATAENYLYVSQYLRLIVSCAPLFMLDMLMNVFVRNDKAPAMSMKVTVVCCIVNIVLDVVFIFGFNLGMVGAALGTVLATATSVGILIIYSFSQKSHLKFKWIKFDWQVLGRILFAGTSNFVLEASIGVVTFAFNIVLLKQIGEIGVSAYSIISNLHIVCYSIFLGISQACQPIVSINYGAKQMKRVKQTFVLSVICSFVLGLFFFAVGELFPRELASIFVNDDPELINIAVNGIRLYFISYLVLGFNLIFATYFQAINRPKISIVITVCKGLIFIIAVLLILSAIWGVNGVWLSAIVAESLTLILCLLLYASFRRTIAKKITTNK